MITHLVQALVNGVIAGALIAVTTIGFTTIYAVLRYPNLAVAGTATVGAFAGWWANLHWGAGTPAILACGFCAAAVAGVICERVALRRLMAFGALTVTVASIAVNLVLENLVRFVFGNDLHSFNLPIEPDLVVGGVFVDMQQVWNLLLAVLIVVGVFGFLKFTRWGRAMRAVSDNPDLARLKAIDPNAIAVAAVALGCGLAGAGGVLIGLDTSIDPMTGDRVLLSVFAAAVLGGLGSIPGSVVGAVLLGIAEEVALLGIAPSYRTAVGFVAILVVLTFRPSGLFGERAV
jgi:branched-chain amino acid transport system permease protein